MKASKAKAMLAFAFEPSKQNERNEYDAAQPSEAEMLRFSASEASKANERSEYGAEHEKRVPKGLFFHSIDSLSALLYCQSGQVIGRAI